MTIKTATLRDIMKKVILMCALLSINVHVVAQDQHVVDSITPLLRNDNSRSDMEIFYELGFQYATSDHNKSLEYLDKGLALALSLKDSLKIVKINRMKAQVLCRDGRQAQAIFILEKILPTAKRLDNRSELGDIFTTLGLTHTFMAHYDVALEHNFRALEVWRGQKNQNELAAVFNNIGLVHYKVGNFEKAIIYYSQAISIAEKEKLNDLSELIYCNIALANIVKGDTVEARRWYNKQVSACASGCIKERSENLEYGLGYLAYLAGNLQTAKAYFNKAHALAVEIDDPLHEAGCLFKLGEVNHKEKRYSTAYSLLIRALEISEGNNYRNLTANLYMELFELYKKTNQQERASSILERYVNLRDSIYSTEVRNKIMIAQTEFEEKENKLIIANKERLLAEQKTQAQLIAVICILLCLLAGGLFIILRNKQRANLKLDHRVIERTRDLELHKTALERVHQEQNELIAKTSQSIKSVLATHRGLTNQQVINEPRQDLSNVESELDSLEQELSRIKSKH